MANVLLLNGSPHAHGAIDLALTEVAQTLQECGLTTEIVHRISAAALPAGAAACCTIAYLTMP